MSDGRKPYDIYLSSHSKYKIISENQTAKEILKTESANPGNVATVTNEVCKRLVFGKDKTGLSGNMIKNYRTLPN